VLVEAARVDADALVENGIVLIALGALPAEAVDGHVALLAIAVEGIDVEDLVGAAAVAHGLVAPADLDGSGLAIGAVVVIIAEAVVVGQCYHCQQHNQEDALSHCQFISIRI